MRHPRAIRRVVLVVLDALRPDAFDLSTLCQLARTGASTMAATTIQPSVTFCAMASLLTGVAPAVHGLDSDRLRIPRPRGRILPRSARWSSSGADSSYCTGPTPTVRATRTAGCRPNMATRRGGWIARSACSRAKLPPTRRRC